MGIHSVNRYSSVSNIQVEAAEEYQGQIGIQLAMIEGFQNDYALFDGSITDDFHEASMVHEGAAVEEIQAVQESAMGDFLTKIKEFFVKLWEKIKGIFKGFMAKFDSVVMKSNKEFHDRYSKAVYAKDLTKMKTKYSEPKNAEFDFAVKNGQAAPNKPCLSVAWVRNANNMDKIIEDFDRDEYICNILNGCKPQINISEVKEYEKEVHDACFGEEDEKENFSNEIHKIGQVLVSKDPIEQVRKVNGKLDKAMSEIIRDIEKSRDEILKLLPKTDNDSVDKKTINKNFGIGKDGDGNYKSSTDRTEYNFNNGSSVKSVQKALGYIHTQATAIQTAVGMFTSASLRETKFGVAQARRVFAAAVAFNPKSVKESADMMAAMEEAALYEIETDFGM